MTTRQTPRLALRLLRRYVPDNEPLAGDILEEFADGRSHLWLWWQVVAAVATALIRRDGVIRPLQLVDQQPLDALQRTLQWHRRRRVAVVGLTEPLPAGLGLVILGGLVTALAPIVWLALLATFAGGVALAGVLVAAHRRQSPPPLMRRLT